VKHLLALIAGITAIAASTADAQQPNVAGRRFSPEQVRSVAPALEEHTQERLYGAVWNRPGLNHRDRSLITIAALIARGQAPALGYYADRALENGVTAREISETIVHLAYYSGWGAAMAAVGPVSEVFAKRGIGRDQLPREAPQPLPLNEAAEAQRAKSVGDQFGAGARRVHDRLSVPRLVAAARSRAARPEPRHGRGADRLRPGRASHVSSQSRDG
jgi:4-carboxymuconolactone decarboxylase